MVSDKNIFMAEAIKLAADNLRTGNGGPFWCSGSKRWENCRTW